jgi:DNA-binding phage protein
MPRSAKPKHREENLGRNARIFEDADVIRLLRAAIEREGSITAFAKRHGLPRSNVSNILSGRRPITIVVKALGLRWVCVADQ